MKIECDGIVWMLGDLVRMSNELQDINHYDLDKREVVLAGFDKIVSGIEKLISKIEYMAGSKKVEATLNERSADLVINSGTPIFLNFYPNENRDSFSDYFNKNLNPDVTSEGFLEQLAGLLKIAEERPLTICMHSCSKQEYVYFNVIKEYIESQ